MAKKGNKFDQWVLGLIVVSIVIIALVLWGPLRKFHSIAEHRPAPQAEQREPAPAQKPAEHAPKKEPRKQATGPALLGGSGMEKTVQIAIVIDDLGTDMKQAREILALPAKITFAVMPGLSQSKKIAVLAKQEHRDVLIHVPMEYHGKNGKPSPGMLRSDMTPMQFLTIVSDDVDSVPGAVGINNHEGSTLTENKEAMKFLMAELKARNLMFLDSVTSPKSVAYATAKEFGLKSARRDVFLDNDSDNPGAIRKQLDELVQVAQKNGWAIGIGHPHPATIGELRIWLVGAEKKGVEIVPVSKLMN